MKGTFGDDGNDEHQHGGRKDSPNPAGVETEHVGPSRRDTRSPKFGESSDDKAGNDEEYVDADVATEQYPDLCVYQDNEQDGNGPQTEDVGPKCAVLR